MTRTQANPAQRQAPPQTKPAGNGQQPPTKDQQNAALLDEILGRLTEYTPLAESAPIKLSVSMVRQYLCVPTRQGHMPPDSEIIKFITMCKARALNPWAGDCYLLGYDTEKHGPKFSIVVAIQALFKRAEINDEFDGIESGIVVMRDSEIIERAGDLKMPDETLLGGWARVHRKDRKFPFYQRLKLQTYKKNTPIWTSDPEGMISKCAESGALRQAFPSEVGGLYLHEELIDMDKAIEEEKKKPDQSAAKALMDRMLPKPAEETVVGKAPVVQEAVQTRQDAPGEHDQDTAPEGREPGSDDPEPAVDDQGPDEGAAAGEQLQFGK
jgi:phage recombination protein Bet